MIKNYIKIAWRNIRKHRLYSAVNIIGLFAGVLFFFLIAAYVWGEYQVNRNLKNAAQQYILTSKWKDPNMGYDLATFGPMAKRLKEDYPNLVKNYYRSDGVTAVVSKGDKKLQQQLQMGDSTMLTMYGFKVLNGDPATALNAPFSVVLTKKVAEQYFNKTNVVGEMIAIRSFKGTIHDFKVTAVIEDPSENSITNLAPGYPANEVFVPALNYDYFVRNNMDDWRNPAIASYIELQQGVELKDLIGPIQQLLKQNTSSIVQNNLSVVPIALTEYRLVRNNGAAKRSIITLSLIAIFILLMAIINFINVSISSAGTRMREIGVRKVVGGQKRQIVFQFLAESTMLVFIAVMLAIGAYPITKNIFESVVGKQLPALSSFPVYFLLVPVALIFLIGFLSGLYPAFRLSAINSVNAMKGTLKSVNENVLLRKGLIAFQFTIAIVVLVAALIITQQVTYFFGQQLGYDKEYIVSAQAPRDWSREGVRKMTTIRDQFAKMPEVADVSLSYEIPNGNSIGLSPVYKLGADSTSAMNFQVLSTDEKYLNTYQIPLAGGRFFEGARRDSGQVILNETGVKALGYKNTDEAIGKQIRAAGDPTTFTIKGVVKDFHFDAMNNRMSPLVFFDIDFNPVYRFLSFKLKPGNIQQSLDAIQKKWGSLIPETSFEYRFMDDNLRNLYAKELQLKNAAYTATILTIIIVLLGVFSLVSLNVQKRVKEIGVRKVLGASVVNIMGLFAKEFLGVLLLAGIVAVPLAYWVMKNWLQNYAYHIQISLLPFVLALAGIGVIVFLLIMMQTTKAATSSPVKSLRNE